LLQQSHGILAGKLVWGVHTQSIPILSKVALAWNTCCIGGRLGLCDVLFGFLVLLLMVVNYTSLELD